MDKRSAHDQQEGAPATGAAPAVWSLLDRPDPAWKTLYTLYNPEQPGRAAGQQFSEANRRAAQAKAVAARALSSAAVAAAAARAAAAEQQQRKQPKFQVAVPHFRPRVQQAVDPLAAMPRRRAGAAIVASMAEDAERSWGCVPLPAGRLIGEQEKQRCALLMQFNGAIPSGLTPAGGGSGCSSSMAQPAARPGAQLQQRFGELEQEVAEREAFVASMQQLGRLVPAQAAAMRAEAAAKVQEMRQLDGQIRQLDARWRQEVSSALAGDDGEDDDRQLRAASENEAASDAAPGLCGGPETVVTRAGS